MRATINLGGKFIERSIKVTGFIILWAVSITVLLMFCIPVLIFKSK
jgi:hypothetical protein